MISYRHKEEIPNKKYILKALKKESTKNCENQNWASNRYMANEDVECKKISFQKEPKQDNPEDPNYSNSIM